MELMQRTLYKIQIKVPEIVCILAAPNQRQSLASLYFITFPIDDVSMKGENLFDFS